MLELRNIIKHIDKHILVNISFKISQGEYFVLLGKSGAGKTMILEIIAGLLMPDSGQVILDGHDITGETIQKRGIGIVYQDRALFPHMSVRENIAYALQCRGVKKTTVHTRVEQIAGDLGLTALLKRKPGTLSEGEGQRVALARTLAVEPKCLLLDEPISSLDVQAKSEIRSLLRKINRNGTTILHVTHDYEETISLAAQLAVIEDGRISQTGTPSEVFQHPRSEFIAKFVGIKNVIKGELVQSNGNLAEFVANGKRFSVLSEHPSGTGFIILRGEDITVSNFKPHSSARNLFKGIVTDIGMDRQRIEVTVDIGRDILALITRDALDSLGLNLGDEVWISFKASAVKYIED